MENMVEPGSIKSVAIIGAGAAGKPIASDIRGAGVETGLLTGQGAIAAAALSAEGCYDRIRVFERKSSPGGTWYVVVYPPYLSKTPCKTCLPLLNQ